MSDTHVANLSKPVSEQVSGIVLVWTAYDDGTSSMTRASTCYQYVPKGAVAAYPGMGAGVLIGSATGNRMGWKYVYVHDDRIVGHASNDSGETVLSSGLTVHPREWVLVDVFGV